MAQWNELSAEDQTLILDWMNQLLRPVSGELARVLYHLDVVKAAYVGPADIAAVMATLDADAIIPNSSGLSGAVDIEKQDIDPMLTALNSLLTGYYTAADLQRYVALAGASNVLG